MLRGGYLWAPFLSLPLMAAAGAESIDAPIPVPSGHTVTFLESIIGEPGPAGLTARFRFVAPQIARDLGLMTFQQAEVDMHFLCETYALPRLAYPAPQPSQVVISLSDSPVPFGEPSPDVTQFFEAYLPEGDRCIWEGY